MYFLFPNNTHAREINKQILGHITHNKCIFLYKIGG